jgi:hypothetical protein
MTLAAFHPRTGFWISLLIAAAGALAVAFLPWETIGAPMLSVLLFGGMAVGLALRDSPAEERRFVIRLLLVALAVRLLAALLFGLALGGGGSYLPSDAVSYDRAAWVMARNWRSPALPPEGLGPLEFIFDDFYPRLLGGLYFLLGHSPAAAVALNGVLGASTVYLVYRIGAMLFGPVVARWAGWLAVFYTGFWFWEMMTLKDALFLFLILLFFLALYRIWGFLVRPDRSGAHLLRAALWGAVLVLIFLAAGEIRVYVPLLLLIAAGLLPVASFLRPDGRGRWILVIGAVAVVLAVFWPKIMSRGLVPVAVNPDSMLFQVTELPATENVGVFLDPARYASRGAPVRTGDDRVSRNVDVVSADPVHPVWDAAGGPPHPGRGLAGGLFCGGTLPALFVFHTARIPPPGYDHALRAAVRGGRAGVQPALVGARAGGLDPADRVHRLATEQHRPDPLGGRPGRRRAVRLAHPDSAADGRAAGKGEVT